MHQHHGASAPWGTPSPRYTAEREQAEFSGGRDLVETAVRSQRVTVDEFARPRSPA